MVDHLQFKSIRKIHKEYLPKSLPDNKNLSPERNAFRKCLAKFKKDKFIRLINDVIIVMAERMNETCYILEASDFELTSASGMNQDNSQNANILTEDMLSQSRQQNEALKENHF